MIQLTDSTITDDTAPLIRHIYSNNVEQLESFLTSGQDYGVPLDSTLLEYAETPLHAAIKIQNVSILRTLLKHTGPIKITPGTWGHVDNLLRFALESYRFEGTNEVVKLLVEYGGVRPEYGGNMLGSVGLNRRCNEEERKERMELMEILLEAGFSMYEGDDEGITVVDYAVMFGPVEVLELFIRQEGFDWKRKLRGSWMEGNEEFGLLHLACRFRCVESFRILVDSGKVDLEGKTKMGRTPMHFCGMDELMYKPKWDQRGVKICFPITMPVFKGTREELERGLGLMRILKEHGVDVNSLSGINGWTPLHILARMGDSAVEMGNYLLENGADINKKDKFGRTPLHIAVLGAMASDTGPDTPLNAFRRERLREVESPEMVKLLLNNRAELDGKMDDGFTALDIVLGLRLTMMEKVLRDAGAEESGRVWRHEAIPSHPKIRGVGRGRGRILDEREEYESNTPW